MSDLTQLKIPLKDVAKTNSRSDTADATGSGTTGNKATGSVSIMNSNSTAVTIKAGAVITLSGKSLDYVINNECHNSFQRIGAKYWNYSCCIR